MSALPRDAGQRHGYVAADVSIHDTLRAKVEALVAGKPVHVLVNNTGGPPGGPAHAAEASAYLDAFQRHLLANQVLVQAVLPGMRKAVPAGRFAQPAEVAAAIAFLCSPAAAYINGVSLAVDGGRMQSI